MATYSKEFLSHSTNGKNISITSNYGGIARLDSYCRFGYFQQGRNLGLRLQHFRFSGRVDRPVRWHDRPGRLHRVGAGSRFRDDVDRSWVPAGQQPDCEGARCDGERHQRQRFRKPYYCLVHVPSGSHQPIYRCF